MKKIQSLGKILSKKEQRSINAGFAPSCRPYGTQCTFLSPGPNGPIYIDGICDGNCNCEAPGVSHNGSECSIVQE